MRMESKAHQEAAHFLENEKQFHLGVLPTEQSNPKTRHLDVTFAGDISEGVRMLLSVDRDVHQMARQVLSGSAFKHMVDTGIYTIREGRKIVFSGCGATGRLSILLESMWRCFFRDLRDKCPRIYDKARKYENSVWSIMTGGDYALIRSVEYFEDYHTFGQQQVREVDVGAGDMLVGITEGGETSSVLGTVTEAADRGAEVFLLFNNPSEILCKHIERSGKVIEDPRVTVLDLYCGPMAVSGSTRMQATTSEQLVAGAALETILARVLKPMLSPGELNGLRIREIDYAASFNLLLDELSEEENIKTIGALIRQEKNIYQESGLVTYFANQFLLDIFTDTTERAPTFMIPPFKKSDDHVSPPSWAFVKNPLWPTDQAWEHVLGRPPRCLTWDSEMYRRLGASSALMDAPPLLDQTQLVRFRIGDEADHSRLSRKPNAAVSIIGSREVTGRSYHDYKQAFERNASEFLSKYSVIIGRGQENADYKISCSPAPSILNLMEHMAFKLVLNTISTGTMVLMGRVTGNWMSWVEVSNKKLKDRGIRLIAGICGLSYRDSCYALHETLEELKTIDTTGMEKFSPVQYTIAKLRQTTDR